MYRMPCPKGTMKYTIKPGDTLYKIAIKYNTTVPMLLFFNPFINPYNLMIGSVICVPKQEVKCPNGKFHTVKEGDTLFTIANMHNISYNALKKANPSIDFDNLQVGMQICTPPYKPSKPCPNNRTYIIKSGETISSIAEKFVVSATDMLKLNPEMAPGEFVEGRLICLPAEAPV